MTHSTRGSVVCPPVLVATGSLETLLLIARVLHELTRGGGAGTSLTPGGSILVLFAFFLSLPKLLKLELFETIEFSEPDSVLLDRSSRDLALFLRGAEGGYWVLPWLEFAGTSPC